MYINKTYIIYTTTLRQTEKRGYKLGVVGKLSGRNCVNLFDNVYLKVENISGVYFTILYFNPKEF